MRRFRVQVSVARWWLGVFLVIMGAMQESAAQELPPPAAGDLKKMSLEDLMDIEVTSVSKRPQKLSVTASAIQVVTNEDIRRSGATSLPEALRLAGNLEVAQIDSRQWAITARGFNNVFADKMLVLIDGRSVYTPLYAGVYWDVQNLMLEDVDRAEVISGPGATQWGSNAVNGVINITTKSAKDTQGGLLVEAAGNELNDLSEVRYGGKIAPGVYYRVYGTYSEIGSSVLPSGGAPMIHGASARADFASMQRRRPATISRCRGISTTVRPRARVRTIFISQAAMFWVAGPRPFPKSATSNFSSITTTRIA